MVERVLPGFGSTTTTIGTRIRMSALTYAFKNITVAGPATWQKITIEIERRWYRKKRERVFLKSKA